MNTIISGTNRPNSYSLKLAKYYQKHLEERGLSAQILSLTDLPDSAVHTDMYNPDKENFNQIQDLVSASTKFLFIIPEYNGGFPGILKTFIDACKFPESFYGKKAALVGLSAGKYGNIRGIEHFTGICNYINLHVMPLKIHIPGIHSEFDEQGNLFKEDTVKFTHEQMEQFISY